MKYLLINTKSHSGRAAKVIDEVKELLGEIEIKNILEIEYKEFIPTLKSDDEVTIAGGDGTLNHFVNEIKNIQLPCPFYFYTAGTGNDFKNDLANLVVDNRIYLNEITEKLPYVIVNGAEYRFINGVGAGLDGFTCAEVARVQEKKGRPGNYYAAAIKGLLGKYKPSTAKVTVDGEETKYEKIWFAAIMIGRFFGGGMMIAPKQDRFNEEHTMTNVVVYKATRFGIITKFPAIFKGTHDKYTKISSFKTGHNIKVEFETPESLQIDGEVINNVTSFEVIYNK